MTLVLLMGRPELEKEKCLLSWGTPWPFTKFQAPLHPSTFLISQGPCPGEGEVHEGARGDEVKANENPGSSGATA